MPFEDRDRPMSPARDRYNQRQGALRQSRGPDVSQMPGSAPTDYQWNPDSLQWEFIPTSRPGMIYINPQWPDAVSMTKSGRTGWVPKADYKEPGHGLFGGWTKGQLGALAAFGGGAIAAPALIGALGGAAGAAGGGGVPGLAVASGAPATLGSTVPALTLPGALAATSYAGSAALPVAGAGAGGVATGTAAAAGAAGTGGGMLGTALPYLIGAAGQGLSAYGQGKMSAADRAQRAREFAAEMQQRQYENEVADQRTRSTTAMEANPLGAYQQFAQRQALAKALLGGARNVKFTPGDPDVAAAMGSFTGGLRLPEGGFDPDMLERLYGDIATQSSIGQRQKEIGQVNPRTPTYDLANLFGKSADGSENAFTTDVRTTNKMEADRAAEMSRKNREALQQALGLQAAGGRR